MFVGFVKLVENYTNQCAAKDGIVANLDMDYLSRAVGTFYNIVKEVKKFVDYDKHWVDYPAFLLPPGLLQMDLSSSRLESPPSPTLPAPLVLGAPRCRPREQH